MKYEKTNKEILKQLNEVVAGHEETKKTLISAISRANMRHYQKYVQDVKKEDLLKPAKVLLIGGSGTGKTYLVECLKKVVDFPLLKLDATVLNPTGASGGVKPENILRLAQAICSDHAKNHKGYHHSEEGAMDRLVIFVDELDKLARVSDSSGNWNRHVQESFLTIFENNAELAGVTWIFAGAFVGLEKVIEKKSHIGFGKQDIEDSADADLDEAVVKYGIVPELVGRLTAISKLDTFTHQDYVNIINNTLIKCKQKEMVSFHTDAIIDEETVNRIAKDSAKSGQGVRYAIRQLNKLFLEIEFDFEDRAPISSLSRNMLEHRPMTDEEMYDQLMQDLENEFEDIDGRL